MLSASDPPNRSRVGLHAKIRRWVRSATFARDISVVLAFKLVLLVVLKFAFFNHPQAGNMSMPPDEVARVILSTPAPNTR